ncbi:hypothetical protein [Pseudonocardia lacus]|uniref:hypothetical protein n=1 Tax=Pseudonocardia lacus TaxID=2835865 RepID=UPI001BDC9C06|nr:hypothetical protein [Pseudonocardia lacus]
MYGEPHELAHELTELRRGRGIDATDAHRRVGPQLRRLCGIDDEDQPTVVRRKLVLLLGSVLDRLPADLRLAAASALGLHEEATGQFLDRRVAWLAERLDRDARTARRRIDQAFAALAQHLAERPAAARSDLLKSAPGWYVQELRALLRLDVDPPQLFEERRVVSTVEELDELELAFSAPRRADVAGTGAIEVAVLYGGEIVERSDVSSSHTRFVLRLPGPLRVGQPHEYAVTVTSHALSDMRTYYVLTPLRATERFVLRVRFDRAVPPSRIWRVEAVPARVVDDAEPPEELLALDATGEVRLEFAHLEQGLSYGVQWQTPPTTSADEATTRSAQ